MELKNSRQYLCHQQSQLKSLLLDLQSVTIL